jgi:8-oxo-dGTP pyrophosphatase MutT (NUDIX family)
MWVFPGGRVDAADEVDADPADQLSAARRAAAREAREEIGLHVTPEELVPFSNWTPPPVTARRFATWFFLAPVPAGDIVVDGGEILDHRWLSPDDALRRRDAGEIELAPPTWITLHELGGHASVVDALEQAGRREPEFYETRIATVPEGVIALYDGDAGYADRDPDRVGPRHRLWMLRDGWRYERTASSRSSREA